MSSKAEEQQAECNTLCKLFAMVFWGLKTPKLLPPTHKRLKHKIVAVVKKECVSS